MTHDGIPRFEHGDDIIKDEPCKDVTHEPISVTGPENADSPSVDPRFGLELGQLTGSGYDYAGKLDLDGEDCEIDLCLRDGTPFQQKEYPLQVGFEATEKDDDDVEPVPCRWVVIGEVILHGAETYGAATLGISSRTNYCIDSFTSDPGACPYSVGGIRCTASTDVEGTFISTQRIVVKTCLGPRGRCADETDLGPSLIMTQNVDIDLSKLTTCADRFATPDDLITVTTTIASLYHNKVVMGNGFFCSPNFEPPCFATPTGNHCQFAVGDGNVNGDVGVHSSFQALHIISTTHPGPVDINNWFEAASAPYSCCN